MSVQTQPERAELSALLEKHLSDTESPPSRDPGRVVLLRAYFDSLRGAGHASEGARLLQSGHPGLTAEGMELAAALLDGLAIDPTLGDLLPRTYRRTGSVANEVLSLAIELRVAAPSRREAIRERLADIVAVEGGDGVFQTLAAMTDSNGATPMLLALAAPATLAGAFDEFVALLDARLAAGEGERGGDGERDRHALAKARAEVLAADTADPDRAAEAYRRLVDAYRRPEDVRAFEAFVESRPSAEERHRERRWLFDFHARTGPSPTDVLAAWARAEEDYGAPEEAVAVYERLFAADPSRSAALEAIARLRLDAGQYEAALEPLRTLRERSDESGRRGLDLGIARLLLDELGRPLEAAEALGPLLAVTPPLAAAQEMAARLLADETVASEVSSQFEAFAVAAEPLPALRILAFLVHESRAPAREEMEDRWLERIAALAEADPPLALAAILKVAPSRPADAPVWEAAERLGRQIGQRDAVSSAYWQVLESPEIDPSQAEAVGKRFLAWNDDQPIDPGRLVAGLSRVLALAPHARWALDRVKLVMGSQGRWDELFDLYDRAIDAVAADDERAALLAEAAFAAKDLAGHPERAIRYLEIGRTLRPEDAATRTSLERLYEKQGQTRDLIGLYSERLSSVSGFEQRQLRKKIADSWLDLGIAENAISVLEASAEEDAASTFDMAEVLERIVASVLPAADAGADPAPSSDEARDAGRRAIALLRRHYEEAGRTADVVRLVEASLGLAPDAAGEKQALRDLVAVAVRHEAQTGDAMAAVFARIEAQVAEKPELAKAAYRALLVAAIRRRKQFPVPGDAAYADARDAAWIAVDRLKAVLLDEGDAAAARRLLARASALPFEHDKRRELLAAAAVIASEHGEDRSEAIRLFARLFEADPGDDVAARSLATFAALLEEEGQLARLAALIVEQARIAGTRGRASEHRALWERAAGLWEAEGSEERAIAAFEQSAALGSETSYEALARIHTAREAWPDAARALAWLTAHASGETRTERTMRLSEAYEAMGERSLARACLEQALAKAGTANPGPMTERLMALYRDDASWGPLAELLAAEGHRSRDAKTAFLCEAADLFWSRLSDPERAARLFAEAIAADPSDPALRRRHADVLEALGRWDEAAETLRSQIDSYGDARSRERALAHQRRARALVRAGRPSEALGDLRLAAEMAAGDASILQDLARVALDRGEVELAESTYRVLLLALHQKPKGAEPDAPDRARVFLDLGEIAARAGDAARAADMVDSAFDTALEQGDDPAPLEETLSARGRFDLLARALERRVRRATALAPRATALGHLAAVHDQRLGRPVDLGARIVEYTEAMLREIDREPVTDLSAWTALASVPPALGEAGASLGGRDRLAGLLASAIARGAAGADRGELTLALARMLLEPPARAEDAIGALMSLRMSDPGAPGATELLGEALESTGRWDDLAGLLREELESLACVESDERFARTALRLGEALEKAGRVADARRVYESVLDRRPPLAELLAELADRLDRSDSKSAGEALEAWLAIDPARAVVIAERLVKRRDADADEGGAVRALEAGFAADPANATYRDRLVVSYDANGRPDDAVRILRRAADLEAEGPALVALLEGILDRQPAAPGATETALRLVDLLAKGGDVKRARARIGALLEREPANAGALERAAALAATDGDWAASLDANRKLLATLPESQEAARAKAAAALVDAAEHAGRIADAREPLVQALEGSPGERARAPEIARALERVYETTGEKRALATLLVERAGREGNASEKTRLRLRAADLLLDAGAPATAWDLIEAAAAAEPENLDALFLQGRAQVAFGRPEDALAVLGTLALRQQGKRTPLMGRAYFEIAKAHLMLDELFAALEALDFAAAIDRRSDEIALLLALVALDLGDEKTAERALIAITTMPPRKDGGGGADAATKALAFYHLASLAYAKGDAGKAKRLAGRAVGAGDPAHTAARALLERLEAHPPAAGSHA
jgi:Flp pilus assembly protein TadD